MYLKGEINFKGINYKLKFWQPKPYKVVTLRPRGVHHPVLGTSQGIHPTHSYDYYRRLYSNGIDPVIIDHAPIITATQGKRKTFDTESFKTMHERMRKLRMQQKLIEEQRELKLSTEWIKKTFLSNEH